MNISMIKKHRFIVLVITLSVLGLTAEGIMEHWETWVIPFLIAGVIGLWILHVGQITSEPLRENLYFGFACFATLFHGVHGTSFFDVCSVVSLLLVLFSLYDRVYILNMVLVEYVLIMVYQFILAITQHTVVFNSLEISRICLQVCVIGAIYFICRRAVKNRLEQEEVVRKRDEAIEAYDNDMEDFLSNVSHELRTPVNVVNGMATMLLNQGSGKEKEVESIRDAGFRLSNQIEDIQDYTEVKQESLVLEEENYMITSLINDVVADFRRYSELDNLELVVDLSPYVPTMMKGDVRKLKKILRHLLDNAIKFTKAGGIFIRIYVVEKKYGVNLTVEVTDTGIGMKRRDLSMVGTGLYQANKKRDRSSGGIGLGLPVVYGLIHKMGGFVKIESHRDSGTTVRVTVPQEVIDRTNCLMTEESTHIGDILFHVRAAKYRVPAVRDYYRSMATNLARGIKASLFSADNIREVERLMERLHVSHIFMGEEEYLDSQEYFDKLSKGNIVIAVSARPGFQVDSGSRVIVMPKPLYGFPVVRILNGETRPDHIEDTEITGKIVFENVHALIVDDEPMNLVVATGMFGEYHMTTDTALSGMEAIEKCEKEHYDIIFMDHMMPEMDGVEAMKRLKEMAGRRGREITIVALTANAVSGAREMFINEGFDGFIAKPIDIGEFERVMKRVLPKSKIRRQDV